MSRRNPKDVDRDAGITPRRSPRFLQTPLRRSPRFHPQTSDTFLVAVGSQSKNNRKDASLKQSRSKSSPISSNSVKIPSLKRRRSRASRVSEEVQRRRSPRLALRAGGVSETENVPENGGVEGLEEKEERKSGNSEKSIPIEGGERKRKRIGRVKGEEVRVEREVEECGGLEGWTKEQELELQRAYLTARPSPHFWKKVSKMVPGKSAQECFDRIHADLVTPPQHQPVSRTTKSAATPIADFTLSSSIASFGCSKTNSKNLRGKQKVLAAQKTVRHLLRKHQLIDQSKAADLFSVLETSPTALTMDFPEVKTPATPPSVPTSIGFLKRCSERSLSTHKSKHSRFRPPDQANYASPEVLKPIKNILLHEKYINQLHCREARRQTLTKTSSVPGKDSKNIVSLKTDVKAARTALMSEAKDAITQFQHLLADPFGEHADDDTDLDGFSSADDDEEEE